MNLLNGNKDFFEKNLSVDFLLNFFRIFSKLKKVESVFTSDASTVSDVIATNHKGQTDMLFHGLHGTNARFQIYNS